MAVNKKLLVKKPVTGITPSEHFGVVLYEGDGKSGRSVNGGKFGAGATFGIEKSTTQATDSRITTTYYAQNVGSISGWLKKNGNTSELEYVFVTKDDTGSAHQLGINLLQEADSDLSARVGNGSSTTNVNTSGLTLNNDAWHHFVVTWNLPNSTNNVKVYVNGSLEATGSQSTGSWTGNSSRTFQLGHYPSHNTNNGFAGMLDQVRVFEKELSSSEVSTLYAETADTVTSLDPLSEDTTDTLQVLGDSSCTSLYRFENNEDDESGNYDGTGNQIQYSAGRYGQAVKLGVDANNSYVDITTATTPTTSTLSLWFKTSENDSNWTLIVDGGGSNSSNTGYAIFRSGDGGYINLYFTDSTTGQSQLFTGTTNITDDVWHHIVLSMASDNTFALYLDGSSHLSGTRTRWTSGDTHSVSSVRFGNAVATSPATINQFNGEIDQIRTFNKAISSSEVTTLYQENSLVASYRFEGNSNDDRRNYNGSDNDITYEFGLNFTPDLVWIKDRSATFGHRLIDSSTGTDKYLESNSTSSQQGAGGAGLISFDTGGFTVGSGNAHNKNEDDFVAWCFKANGGTTSSNTDGSITSTVQANTDAGFSIVKYTGTFAAATVGHGLSAAPEMIIVKNLDSTTNWWVWHTDLGGGTKYLKLNGNDAVGTVSSIWNSTVPTSTVFSVANDSGSNGSGNQILAYCFKSINGFSKFGTYTGNGSTDGPIVETGFEPAFVMIKNTTTADNWVIFDNARNTTNSRTKILQANLIGSESTEVGAVIDFYSNGFQSVGTGGGGGSGQVNKNANTYIYMCFAADPDTEQPTVAKSFSTVTYTGTGSSGNSITGLGFEPSFLWLKSRSGAIGDFSHTLMDTVRGASKSLSSNNSNAESTNANGLESFDTDGFTVGSGAGGWNYSGSNYVAWAWKADDNEPTIYGGDAVAIYKFDDDANDVTGTYNGTASNVTFGTGKYGNCAIFNGSNSQITTSYNPDDTKAFTWSSWINVTNVATAPNDNIFGTMESSSPFNGVAIFLDVNDIALSTGGSNRGNIVTNVSTGTWYHVAITYNGNGTFKTYKDGSLVSTISQTPVNGGSFWFGNGGPSSWNAFDGKLDQIRLYEELLSDQQISNLYNETASTVEDIDLSGGDVIISANANAGFSIVKYEGTYPTHQKIPHGLSATPEMILIKNLNDTADWEVYHTATGNTGNLVLNSTAAFATNSGFMADTSPTATVFTVGNDGYVNGADDQHIAYCFHSVSGFSKIGSYTGNGSSSGPTVTTGFQPDFVMIKRVDNIADWVIVDSVRGGSKYLKPNSSDAETSSDRLTFTSTGFQLITTGANVNFNGDDYIYAAFKIN